jgi:phosphoribosylaminoimidazolecarboxamide formyltransferase / IMP cyclohydrolase
MGLNTVREIDDSVVVRTVLISVWDKAGLESLVPGLAAACPGLRILSTGGTFTHMEKLLGADASRVLAQVSAYTGQPEMQGGLVKTLDYKIYLGLLAETYNGAHQQDLARAGAAAIDMVVVNLYPFQKTAAEPGATPERVRGTIDIGGPCMVRAAAKNYHRVAAVTDPADYPALLTELAAARGVLSLETRYRLAAKAFSLTAAYDAAIASYFSTIPFRQAAGAYTVKGG